VLGQAHKKQHGLSTLLLRVVVVQILEVVVRVDCLLAYCLLLLVYLLPQLLAVVVRV
jgi:hypothetical protein